MSDPLIALAITAMIGHVARDAWRTVRGEKHHHETSGHHLWSRLAFRSPLGHSQRATRLRLASILQI